MSELAAFNPEKPHYQLWRARSPLTLYPKKLYYSENIITKLAIYLVIIVR